MKSLQMSSSQPPKILRPHPLLPPTLSYAKILPHHRPESIIEECFFMPKVPISYPGPSLFIPSLCPPPCTPSPKPRSTFAKIVCGYACCSWKILLSLYQFFTQLSTHQYPIFKREALNFAQFGAFFYHGLLKIHPIYIIWAPSFKIKTHQSLYQISQNSTQKAGTYTMSM